MPFTILRLYFQNRTPKFLVASENLGLLSSIRVPISSPSKATV